MLLVPAGYSSNSSSRLAVGGWLLVVILLLVPMLAPEATAGYIPKAQFPALGSTARP